MSNLIRRALIFLSRKILSRRFEDWEEIGIHVTPVHFYQPIPDTRELALQERSIWKNSELVGIDMNEGTQLKLLDAFSNYRNEYVKFPKNKDERDSELQFHFNNRMFEEVDAEVLFSMIRYFRPAKIIEVGSGFSTLLIAQACRANKEEGKDSKLSIIDPYPTKMIKHLPNVLLIPKKVQEMKLNFFQQLESNDILFIDTTHVVKIGSDVNYLILEVLPRLKRGVIVHFHDILLPSEYPKKWVLDDHFFWSEQYLLQAFLVFNHAFEVLWAGNYMRLKYPEKLRAKFPSYNQDSKPGKKSFYIRRKLNSITEFLNNVESK